MNIEEQNMTKNNQDSENVLLTPELYANIMSEKSVKIQNLKTLQGSTLSTISEEIDSLNELKDSLKKLKKSIKFTKRALRKENKKLKKVNKSLDLETDLVNYLNESFKLQEETYINSKTFNLKKYQ